jgi:hypothetical protein
LIGLYDVYESIRLISGFQELIQIRRDQNKRKAYERPPFFKTPARALSNLLSYE